MVFTEENILRAFSIRKKLSQGFGKALPEVFNAGNELKGGYEFLRIPKQILARQ
jgi:hypothetical protein